MLFVKAPIAHSGSSDATPPPAPLRCSPADLRVEGGTVRVNVDTPIALREEGPFVPLGTAITSQGALRDLLTRDIAIPSLRFGVWSYARVRFVLLACVVMPMAMLLELDRELVMGTGGSGGRGGVSVGRVVIDALLAAYVVFELTRRSPRMPKIAAMALGAIGLRWALVTSRMCAHDVHALVFASLALPLLASAFLATRVPSRARVTLELLDKMGITRREHFQSTNEKLGGDPPSALIAVAIACAAGLPAILHLVRAIGASMMVQAIVFALFGVLAPIGARRLAAAPASPSDRDKRETGGSSIVVESPSPRAIMMGVVVGLALTTAVVTAGRLFFDVGAELARCVGRLDTETRNARGAEAAELTRAIEAVRTSALLVVLTTAVFPFVEERIYRGLLQDTLTRKYGQAYGVFAASLAFGVAHMGIYQVALYQTVLLGIGFGVAYAEGGLLAAFFVHATWNLMQLAS